jgi:hypothetical protein
MPSEFFFCPAIGLVAAFRLAPVLGLAAVAAFALAFAVAALAFAFAEPVLFAPGLDAFVFTEAGFFVGLILRLVIGNYLRHH